MPRWLCALIIALIGLAVHSKFFAHRCSNEAQLLASACPVRPRSVSGQHCPLPSDCSGEFARWDQVLSSTNRILFDILQQRAKNTDVTDAALAAVHSHARHLTIAVPSNELQVVLWHDVSLQLADGQIFLCSAEVERYRKLSDAALAFALAHEVAHWLDPLNAGVMNDISPPVGVALRTLLLPEREALIALHGPRLALEIFADSISADALAKFPNLTRHAILDAVATFCPGADESPTGPYGDYLPPSERVLSIVRQHTLRQVLCTEDPVSSAAPETVRSEKHV